jgi:hypothetical protein
MAEATNPIGLIATVLALGLAPTVGMMLGGGWLAAFLFVATAAVVTMRAMAKHHRALRDPDPTLQQLTPQQAIGMLSALRGQPLAGSVAARVAEIEELAQRDAPAAHARIVALVEEAPRNVAALILCARLAFALRRPDAAARWATALRVALDTGLNRVAATSFVEHRVHRDALQLDPSHVAALARALEANGHREDALWWRTGRPA